MTPHMVGQFLVSKITKRTDLHEQQFPNVHVVKSAKFIIAVLDIYSMTNKRDLQVALV